MHKFKKTTVYKLHTIVSTVGLKENKFLVYFKIFVSVLFTIYNFEMILFKTKKLNN